MSHVQHRKGSKKPWVARYSTPDGSERSRSFSRKIDADRFLANMEVEKLRGEWADPRLGRTTLNEWSERYWATVTNLRPSTLARDESYVKNHILPAFGCAPLGSINRLDIQVWVSDLAGRRAPATVHKAHQILSKMLRAAVDSGYLQSNPCERVQLPRIERREMRFLTPTEVSKLTDSIDGRYRALVLTAAHTGLRIGELLALRGGHVDLLHRQVDVQETLVEVKGKIIINPPKTTAGRRVVQLTRAAATELDHHLSAGQVGPSDFVFTSPHGGPVRLSLFRRRFWQPAVKRTGLEPLRLHDLRHTAVAFWIFAGASPTEIARRAGHRSVVTVLDRYGHLLPGTEDRVTDELDRLYEEALAPTGTDASIHQIKP
jgi:integrase